MTEEKKFFVIVQYRKHLEQLKAEAVAADHNVCSPSRQVILNHLLSMLLKMEGFIKQGREGKFFRWLGFVQGALWSLGEFSLNELRAHNRPAQQ